MNRAKPRLFKKYLMECEVLIYDLLNADLEEVENVVKTLKSENLEKEITVIGISSVLVWGNSKSKMIVKDKNEGSTTEEETINEESEEEGDTEQEEHTEEKKSVQ